MALSSIWTTNCRRNLIRVSYFIAAFAVKPSPAFTTLAASQQQLASSHLWDSSFLSSSSPAVEETKKKKMMKCIVFGRGDGIPAWSQRERPKLKRNHVIVQVHGVGLNPVDAKGVIGDKLSWPSMKKFAQSCMVHNTIIGFDFSGIVVESNENEYPIGQKVFGTMPPLQGSLAEYVCAPTHQIGSLSPSTDLIQASTVPLTGLTAVQCLSGCTKSGDLRGRSVLVVGASGGTGHMALQVARHGMGASSVVAMCSDRNADFCQKMGATAVVDYRAPDCFEQLRALGPFDVIMDCVTSADPRDDQSSYPHMLQQKSLVTDGYQYRRLGGLFWDWFRAGTERTVGLNLWPNTHEKLFWIQFPHSAAQLKTLASWMDQGHLKPQVAKVYDFDPDSVQQAFDEIMSRRTVGKVAVQLVPQTATMTAAAATTTTTNATNSTNHKESSKDD